MINQLSKNQTNPRTDPTNGSDTEPSNYNDYYDGLFYELYREGREPFYPIQDQAQDFLFYLKLAEEMRDRLWLCRGDRGDRASILEVGCGNGRIASRLGMQGFQVSGIDCSKAMIKEARKTSDQVEWIEADVRNFNLDKKFQLITFPFDGLQHLLSIKDIESGLDCIGNHLDKNGRFVVDVIHATPQYLANILFENGRGVDSVFQDPAGRGTVVVTQTREYDAANQILRLKKFFYFPNTKEELFKEIAFRCYFPQELEILLQSKGFEIERKLGDYQGNELTSQSPKLIFICHKRKHSVYALHRSSRSGYSNKVTCAHWRASD
jgi:SAM-dependent methyltransferase